MGKSDSVFKKVDYFNREKESIALYTIINTMEGKS
jgi:hypothetical protein